MQLRTESNRLGKLYVLRNRRRNMLALTKLWSSLIFSVRLSITISVIKDKIGNCIIYHDCVRSRLLWRSWLLNICMSVNICSVEHLSLPVALVFLGGFFYRQLSTEQAALQESLQKESKVNKRLSMENEELLWKLNNGDLSSPRRVSPTSSSPSHSFTLQSPRSSGLFSSPAVSPR